MFFFFFYFLRKYCHNYLQVDRDDEGACRNHSKGLVVGGSFSVLPHGLKEGSIGDEEGDQRHEDPMEETDEEVLEVEERPLLAREV